ncbi:unknown [Firmicutes bacterium CAG:449]|nr:unknown [Firmicutes bacterium CAG:449]
MLQSVAIPLTPPIIDATAVVCSKTVSITSNWSLATTVFPIKLALFLSNIPHSNIPTLTPLPVTL